MIMTFAYYVETISSSTAHIRLICLRERRVGTLVVIVRGHWHAAMINRLIPSIDPIQVAPSAS
jgi:hypothetical protein